MEQSLDGPPRHKERWVISWLAGLLCHQVSIHSLELNDNVRLGIELRQVRGVGAVADG